MIFQVEKNSENSLFSALVIILILALFKEPTQKHRRHTKFMKKIPNFIIRAKKKLLMKFVELYFDENNPPKKIFIILVGNRKLNNFLSTYHSGKKKCLKIIKNLKHRRNK